MSAGELHVEVQGGDIIIALPGTEFTVTYCRREDPPLVAGRSDWTDDPAAPIQQGEFRARAWTGGRQGGGS
jgi:hypothetical protein